VLLAGLAVGSLVPAAVMSIAAANLYTRGLHRPFFRPWASVAEQARISRYVSFSIKFAALALIIFIRPQYSLDLQLIGGIFVLQTVPALFIGMFTSWFHRAALALGLVVGAVVGMVLSYQIPEYATGGSRMVRAHFGGSAWPLSHLGVDTSQRIYVGVAALVVNLAVVVVATVVLRGLRVPDGRDATREADYSADFNPTARGAGVRHLSDLLDGNRQEIPKFGGRGTLTGVPTPGRQDER
jgi:SSS family solute:Na+ symporter